MPAEGIMRALGRMEGKQDLILQRVDYNTSEIKDLSSRVGKVERRQVYFTGVAAGVAAFAAYFIKPFLHKIGIQ